jgi:hypothetical protein
VSGCVEAAIERSGLESSASPKIRCHPIGLEKWELATEFSTNLQGMQIIRLLHEGLSMKLRGISDPLVYSVYCLALLTAAEFCSGGGALKTHASCRTGGNSSCLVSLVDLSSTSDDLTAAGAPSAHRAQFSRPPASLSSTAATEISKPMDAAFRVSLSRAGFDYLGRLPERVRMWRKLSPFHTAVPGRFNITESPLFVIGEAYGR